MTCSQFRQFYSDFADGLLDECEVVAFEIHLAECAACEHFHRALERGSAVLRRAGQAVPSEDFDVRLFERIARECANTEPSLRHWSGLAGAVLVLAMVGVVGWEAREQLLPGTNPAAAPAVDRHAPYAVRFAGDTAIDYPGKLPVIPVSRDSFNSNTRPAQSFEITVDWMTP